MATSAEIVSTIIEQQNNNPTITISLEEYKELLVIKGKYEELKNQQISPWITRPGTITYTSSREKEPDTIPPYKVTC